MSSELTTEEFAGRETLRELLSELTRQAVLGAFLVSSVVALSYPCKVRRARRR